MRARFSAAIAAAFAVCACAHRIPLNAEKSSAATSGGSASVRLVWATRSDSSLQAFAWVINDYAFPISFGPSDVRLIVDGSRMTMVEPGESPEIPPGGEAGVELVFEPSPGKPTHGSAVFVMAPKNAIDGAHMPSIKMTFRLPAE